MKNLAAIVGTVLLLAGQVSSSPKIEIPHDRIEFGYIPFGSTVSHTLWIKSIGSDTLVIDTIVTGCSCATSPLSNARIAPGDSLEVSFTWDLQRRIGPSGVYPRIQTNARPEPYYIHLTGTTTKSAGELRPVTMLPFRLAFARTQSNSVDTVEVTVKNHSDETIAVTPVSYQPPHVDYSLPDSIGAGETVVGRVWVRPEYLDEEFQGSITFLLSDSRERSITIPYHRRFFLPEAKE